MPKKIDEILDLLDKVQVSGLRNQDLIVAAAMKLMLLRDELAKQPESGEEAEK